MQMTVNFHAASLIFLDRSFSIWLEFWDHFRRLEVDGCSEEGWAIVKANIWKKVGVTE